MKGTDTYEQSEDPEVNWVAAGERAASEFAAAKNSLDQRRATIRWLQAATAAMDDHSPSSSLSGSPGDVLIAALQDLENGVTAPLLRAEKWGTRRRHALECARARAVAAVDLLVEVRRLNGERLEVAKAISTVADLCGMSPGYLHSMRSHVHSRKKSKYVTVAALVEQERQKLNPIIYTFEVLEPITGRPPITSALDFVLMRDRPLHAAEDTSPNPLE